MQIHEYKIHENFKNCKALFPTSKMQLKQIGVVFCRFHILIKTKGKLPKLNLRGMLASCKFQN